MTRRRRILGWGLLAAILVVLAILTARWWEAGDRLRDGTDEVTLSAREEADARGELLGQTGTSTPEEALREIVRVRAEPFAPAVLDHLASVLARLASEADRIAAAALLHRYGREEGTEFLRNALRASPGSPAMLPVATALAMSKDPDSLGLVRESMASYVADSEFAWAMAEWGDPALVRHAEGLLSDASVPRGAVLLLLAMMKSAEAGPGLMALGIPDTGVGPMQTPFHAAMARVGVRDVTGVIQGLSNAVDRPERSLHWWTLSAKLVGPEAAQPVVRQSMEHYLQVRRAFNEAYAVHARGVQDGTRSPAQLPDYPTAAERRLLESVELVRDWQAGSMADVLGRALIAAGQGRSSLLLHRTLAAAVMQVDPERGRERLAGMGVSDRDVAVAIRLNELKRLPAILLPEQRSIALGRPGGLSGGSE